MCTHLRICREPWINCVKWYIGSGLDTELLCVPCAERREQGLAVEVANVCEECFDYATTEVCELVKTGGKPEIQIRSEPFNTTLKETSLPKELGTILDIAPVNYSPDSIWLLLAEDGKIFRFDAETGDVAQVARSNMPSERNHKPWPGHTLKPRLHASSSGEFIAVVNDYGRYGQIIDVRSGEVTLSLDGGDYHHGTVPLSFAFAHLSTRVVAIHRTAWNRLDFSDPSSGKLLSERQHASYQTGEARPEHYLDYFHGALYVSPAATQIIDDGWIWHPLGVPTTWSLDRWFSDNVWESEDGPTKKDLCARDAYWDLGITWLDESRVAIAGIGDGDIEMIDGARVFDITAFGKPSGRWCPNWPHAREVIAFPGPSGKFFSDGTSLFASCESGLSRWCTEDGARTGQLQGFHPTHHHRGAGELVQLKEGVLLRWRTA